MTEIVIFAVFAGVLSLIYFVTSLAKQAERNRLRQNELEEWEGVLDVKRKARDNVRNRDYIDSLQDIFNDK